LSTGIGADTKEYRSEDGSNRQAPRFVRGAVASLGSGRQERLDERTPDSARLRNVRCLAVLKLNTWSSRLAGHYGHLFFVNVEVRENVLYVVMFFERFHELEHLLRRGTSKLNIILWNPGDFR